MLIETHTKGFLNLRALLQLATNHILDKLSAPCSWAVGWDAWLNQQVQNVKLKLFFYPTDMDFWIKREDQQMFLSVMLSEVNPSKWLRDVYIDHVT